MYEDGYELGDEAEVMEEIEILFPIRAERTIRARINHVDRHSDHEFTKRFRLSKECFNFLLTEIDEAIQPLSQRNLAIPSTIWLLLTLRFFATGNMLLAVADFCGISESSASLIIKVVSLAIANLRHRYCKIPEGDDMRKNQLEFYRLARFPSVVGAIDCTHVRIQSPGGDVGENFRNRRGYFSLNVQTVSDTKLRILDIVARWPGSCHDQTIWNNCTLRGRFENGDFQAGVLLGDSGYQNVNYLLTPLAQPRTPAEQLYNEAQIRTRNVVERQYGTWKRRFQILRLEMRLAMDRVQAIITATAVLHNLCINMNEELPPEDENIDILPNYENDEAPDEDALDERAENNITRNNMIQYFSTLL